MINIIEMIDDLNEVEQDVLEEIDLDLVSYTFSTRGGDQLIYLNQVYQINGMVVIFTLAKLSIVKSKKLV